MQPIITLTDDKQDITDILNAIVYFTDDKQIIRIADNVKRSVFRLPDSSPYYAIVWQYPNAYIESFDDRPAAAAWLQSHLMRHIPPPLPPVEV